MDEIELLKKLGIAARQEQPPRMNVVGQVMARIRETRDEKPILWWMAAALSGAAATAAAIVAIEMLSAWQDPLNQWLHSMDTVLR